MKKKTFNWIAGFVVFIIISLIFNICYFIRDDVWNWDYLKLTIVGGLSYIISGLIMKKHR